MTANFTQPRSSPALTSNQPPVGCISLFWVNATADGSHAHWGRSSHPGSLGHLQRLSEHQSGDYNMDSVQNVGAPLANTVSGWWGCLLQAGSHISLPAGPVLQWHFRTGVQCAHRTGWSVSCPEGGWISLVCTAPLCTGLWLMGGLKGTLEILAQCFKKQESAAEIWI